MRDPDIVIIGAGIIGLAAAYHLVQNSVRVTIVDRDPDGDKASLGNAGAIAVAEVVPASAPGVWWRAFHWMFDPLGPLAIRVSHGPRLLPWLVRFARSGTGSEIQRISAALSALNSRAYDDLVPMLAATGLAGELHRKGALAVYESEDGYRRDAGEWECKRRHGVLADELNADQTREMEPALGPLVERAVLMPQWSFVSDPRRIVAGLSGWLHRHGALIERGEVTTITARSDAVM